MSSEIKYLFIGLAIAVVIMLFLITGIVFAKPSLVFPAATPTFTNPPASSLTPTIISTPTITPTPTDSPTPTATATLDALHQMLNSGQLAFNGPLSNVQQVSLYQASMQYIATTHADSVRISKQINDVRYGNPSNTCGPLAIAILRDAGLVGKDVVPHDFWLLNPFIPADRAKLTRIFPPERYDHITITTPLDHIDWRIQPLEPGDFIYIHRGSGGNFDHMLVVNRVDSNFRAYSVTNFNTTASGFMIDERMLYDPNDPTAGLFHEWTKERYAILGSTGFDGIEIWRLHTP